MMIFRVWFWYWSELSPGPGPISLISVLIPWLIKLWWQRVWLYCWLMLLLKILIRLTGIIIHHQTITTFLFPTRSYQLYYNFDDNKLFQLFFMRSFFVIAFDYQVDKKIKILICEWQKVSIPIFKTKLYIQIMLYS